MIFIISGIELSTVFTTICKPLNILIDLRARRVRKTRSTLNVRELDKNWTPVELVQTSWAIGRKPTRTGQRRSNNNDVKPLTRVSTPLQTTWGYLTFHPLFQNPTKLWYHLNKISMMKIARKMWSNRLKKTPELFVWLNKHLLFLMKGVTICSSVWTPTTTEFMTMTISMTNLKKVDSMKRPAISSLTWPCSMNLSMSTTSLKCTASLATSFTRF